MPSPLKLSLPTRPFHLAVGALIEAIGGYKVAARICLVTPITVEKWKESPDESGQVIPVKHLQSLLTAVGEHQISVRVMPGAEWHEAYAERIDFIANEITPQTVIHEVAHVIQIRNDGIYSPDHCENLWMMMGLLGCVLEECL